MSINYNANTLNSTANVLILDDDKAFCDSLVLNLESMNMKTDVSSTINEALFFLSRKKYDLLILDILLHDGNGIVFLNRMRRELKINTPILVISAMADMDIQVKVHNAGADDFMTKPIRDSKMLQIHCESLIRRQYEKKKKLIRYDKLLFDEETDSFFVGTEELRFSPHESSILSALMHKSRIRKSELLIKLYCSKNNNVSATRPEDLKIMDVYLCNIRKTLMKYGMSKDFIRTIRGFGYEISTEKKESFLS